MASGAETLMAYFRSGAGLSVSGAGIETGKLGVHMLAVESG